MKTPHTHPSKQLDSTRLDSKLAIATRRAVDTNSTPHFHLTFFQPCQSPAYQLTPHGSVCHTRPSSHSSHSKMFIRNIMRTHSLYSTLIYITPRYLAPRALRKQFASRKSNWNLPDSYIDDLLGSMRNTNLLNLNNLILGVHWSINDIHLNWRYILSHINTHELCEYYHLALTNFNCHSVLNFI